MKWRAKTPHSMTRSAGPGGEPLAAAPARENRFPARALLWRIAAADRDERDEARERLLTEYRPATDFFLGELGSPSASVRAEALRFLESSLPLKEVKDLLPLLQDHNVDVREQARRTVAGVVERYAQQPLDTGLGTANDESLHYLLQSFSALAATGDMSAGNVMLDVLLSIGSSRPREFWNFYAQCPDQARQNLTATFLARRGDAARRALLLGAAYAPKAFRERVEYLLRRTLAYETVRGDMDLLFTLDEQTRAKVFRGLDSIGILAAYLDKPSWIRPCHRPGLLAMLPQIGAQRYEQAILRALGTPDPDTVLAALRVAVDESIPRLTEAVLHHLRSTDENAVSLALAYLGTFGECDLVQTLLPLIEAGSEAVRREAAQAVYSITHRHLLEHFENLSPDTRRMLSRTLQKLDPAFANTLVGMITEAAGGEKLRLIQMLSALDEIDEDLVVEVHRLCDDEDTRVRASAARLLHLLPDEEERLAVGLRLLFDPDPRVRANGVEEVDLDAPDVIERLLELAEDGSPRERANAIKRLWKISHPEARGLFDRFVTEPDPAVRLSAAWLYGELVPRGTVPALRTYLADPDARIRVQAIYSLGKAAVDAEIRTLTRYLEDQDPAVRRAAQTVIQDRLRLEYQVG